MKLQSRSQPAKPAVPAAGPNLESARILHGIWRIVPSPMVTEAITQAGFAFQIFDCEHGAYDYSTLLPDMLACERHGGAPFIRVSGTSKIEVQRCLDLGARGLVFPQLATPDDFERAAAMMDYAPAGTRGYNPFVRAMTYGIGHVDTSRPWFIPIVETLQAAEQIETIARLPRIDLLYLGAYDLSAQLGCAGQMDAPALTALIDRLIAVARAAGKRVCALALTPDGARALAARGVQAIVHGVDSHRIKQAMGAILAPLEDLRPPASAPAARV